MCMCAAATYIDLGCYLLGSAFDQQFSVLLQAPILSVLKRHGDMLELVLSSLQVTIGLTFVFWNCFAIFDLPMRDIFAAHHATWYSLAQENSVALSVKPWGRNNSWKLKLYEQCSIMGAESILSVSTSITS